MDMAGQSKLSLKSIWCLCFMRVAAAPVGTTSAAAVVATADMSWKPGLSRYLPALRFFACPESPSSRGLLQYYSSNYSELKLLNPNFPLLLRTCENAMPAVTTELEWKTTDVVKFMLQTGRFAPSRQQTARDYLKTDWDEMALQRWKAPGFDPERPYLQDDDWTDELRNKLSVYTGMKSTMKAQEKELKESPEYIRGENALLMTQRVDLWCAGPQEVERAVQHLYKLGRALNDREVEMPDFVLDFVPGADDIKDH